MVMVYSTVAVIVPVLAAATEKHTHEKKRDSANFHIFHTKLLRN